MAKRNPYLVLGVNADSTLKEIKKKYRELAKKYHPDKNPSKDAARKFEEVDDAYKEIIEDRKKKPRKYTFTAKGPDFEYEKETVEPMEFSDFDTTDKSKTMFEEIMKGFMKHPNEKSKKANLILLLLMALWLMIFIIFNFESISLLSSLGWNMLSNRIFIEFALFLGIMGFLLRNTYKRSNY